MMKLIVILILVIATQSWAQTQTPDYVPGDTPRPGMIRSRIISGQNLIECGLNQLVTGFVLNKDQRCEQIQSSWLLDNSSIVKLTGRQILDDKQVNPVPVLMVVDGSNDIQIDVEDGNHFYHDSITTEVLILNPDATAPNPACDMPITFRFTAASVQNIAWDTDFAAIGIPLPTVLRASPNKNLFRFWYNCVSTKWELVASNQPTGTATAYVNFPITGEKLHLTTPTGPDVSGEASVIWFDDTSVECAEWEWTIPGDYIGSPVVRLVYYLELDDDTGHSVAFDVTIDAKKTGAQVQTASFGSNNDCDDSAIPGTAGLPDSITCALTNNDTMAANEPVKFRVCNDPTTGTWEDNLGLFRVRFEYAK